jgi:hypothetical protein
MNKVPAGVETSSRTCERHPSKNVFITESRLPCPAISRATKALEASSPFAMAVATKDFRPPIGVQPMSECLHCDIHELLESRLQNEANLVEIAAKVTEVLADLILMAPADEQSTLMADTLANLGSFLLEKKESADPTNPRRSSH